MQSDRKSLVGHELINQAPNNVAAVYLQSALRAYLSLPPRVTQDVSLGRLLQSKCGVEHLREILVHYL